MKLAAVGSNCIDHYNNLDGGKSFPGGGPVNMAVYTVRNGGSASYIGPVGTDDYGRLMVEAVSTKGVDVSHIHVVEGKTAVSEVELIDGERVFGDYDEGVLETYTLSEEDMDFIAQHDMVVCDLWGKVGVQYPELRARGICTAFDCATRPEDPDALVAIPYTDYLFFSSDNGDTPELREQMKDYQKRGPQLVIAMLGTQGSLCYDGKEFHAYGIVKCDNVVDTMGAGDSYIAGFLGGLADGRPVEECMHLGAATATDTLQYFGAW
ncbi:MAG: fructoselysine 6-kinase [Erysipelotrichaceae bacterium]|nr:fructoselysine 6-kinase [Erysipelotrichaceae bacterium]